MYNTEIYKNRKLNEQTAVVSKDYDERLKGYLDSEDFLEVLSDAFKGLEDGEVTTLKELAIDGKEYGILDGDTIHVEVSIEGDKPKYTMYVIDDKYVFDGVNMKTAANLFNQSTKGTAGIVGTVGNYLGSLVGLGDPGDDGTDEDALTAVAGALGMIAAEKRLDPKVYFDALADKVGGITGKLETEFSGRAEATALNLFRRPISSSWTRGTNLGAILGDIALTIGTLGIGTIGSASLKGGSVATKAVKYTGKANKVKKSLKGTNAATGSISKLTSKLTSAFTKLPEAAKVSRLNKLAKNGTALEYTGDLSKLTPAALKAYKPVKKTIHSIKDGQIFWKGSAGGAINGPLVGNVMIDGGMKLSAGSLAILVPGTAKKLAIAGGGVSAANKAESMEVSSMNPAELMGYYDGLTADPSSYLAGVEAADSETLAQTLVDLKAGTGLWGNTTDSEELQIALIITSLTPTGAKEIAEEYAQLDPGSNVYDVLDDELGGDMGLMAKVWWAALTGEGIDNHPMITQFKQAIESGGK